MLACSDRCCDHQSTARFKNTSDFLQHQIRMLHVLNYVRQYNIVKMVVRKAEMVALRYLKFPFKV
jgi:hypothetical protein